jgi:hypothetical protein
MLRLDLLPSAPFFPTASELRRAAECVAPWALGLPETEDAPSEWADFGKVHHEQAQDIANGDETIPDVGLTSVAIFRHLQEAILEDRRACKPWLSGTGSRCWWVEQGIKWRPGVLEDEAEFCERQPGERARGWFAGTADLVYVRHDGVLVVADWKFGPREHVNGEPAKDSCQGFFLALAFCTALGITGSSGAVVVARFERRMVSSEGIEVDAHDITWGELCAWRDTLAGLAKRITSAVDAAPKLSAACGHCKAKDECPAWGALDLELTYSAMAVGRAIVGAPDTQEKALAYHLAAERAEAYAVQWKRLRDAYVLAHPEGVVIGLGLKLKAIPSKDREVLDTLEGLDAIERIVPGGVLFERKAGIGTIEKAIAAGVDKANLHSSSDKKKTKKAELERIFAELTAAGAVVDKGKKLTVRVVRSDEKEY